MALPERTFGPSLDGSSAYLDTSKSQWVDAGSVEGSLLVPGGDFVLEAQYTRLGPDLFLSGEGYSVFVKGYFTHEQPPDLLTTDGGAVVRGSVATRLAGPANPGQFAQAETTLGVQPIGIVDNADGRAFLSRLDGTNVLAETGTPVFLGDIVETEGGASIGITFIDDSTFALGESGRMIIDELVFDPVVGTGQSSFNVLKGVFSFVSGDIADTGDDAMLVTTPVLSIGVRGTTVAGRAAAEGSQNTVTLLPDAGGTVGAIAVSNDAGVQVMSQAFSTTTVTSQFQAPAVPVQIPAATIENLYGDISTVLPPSPSSRGEDTSSDSDDGAPQQRATEEQTESSEEGETESEADDGEPDSESEIEGELEDGLEEEGLTDEELGERVRPDGEPLDPGELAAIAEEAYEKALAEGLSPEEAGIRARDAVEDAFADEFGPRGPEDEFSAIAEEAYEQALAEGLSPEEAELRARDALEEAFGDEFGPRIPGGEMAAVAEEAYERALEEGLSPEEAELRAQDAVEDMFADEFGPRDGLGREMAEVAEEAYEEALAEGLSQEEAEFRAQDAVEEVFADEFGPRGPGDFDPTRSDFGTRGSSEGFGAVAEEAYEQALEEGFSPEEASVRARDALEEAFGDEFSLDMHGADLADIADEAYDQALDDGLSPEEASLRARNAVEEVIGSEFAPEPVYFGQVEPDFGPGLSGSDVAEIAEEAFEGALAEGLSPEEAGLRARDAVEDVFGPEFGPPPETKVMEKADFAAEAAYKEALSEGMSVAEAGRLAANAAEDVFVQEFGPPPEMGSPAQMIAMEKADIAAEQAFEQALSEGMSVAEAGRIAGNTAEAVLTDEFSSPEYNAMKKADIAAEQAFEQALSEGMSVAEAGRIAGNTAEEVFNQSAPPGMIASMRADSAAERAYEQALDQGLSRDEADLRADAVYEGADSAYEQTFEQALTDGLSTRAAESLANRAADLALVQEFAPEIGPNSANPKDSFYELAGEAYVEYGDVAGEAFAEALSEGLSPVEAEARAWDAAEEAFVQDIAPSGSLDFGTPGSGLGSPDAIGAAAGEAFLQALEEGASPAAAAFIAQGEAASTAREVYGSDFEISGGGDDFGDSQEAFIDNALGSAADQAFNQALAGGASEQEAEKAARQVIIRAIDSDPVPNSGGIPPIGEPGRPPIADNFARNPDSSIPNTPPLDNFARGPDSSATNTLPDIGGSIDRTIGNELPGNIGTITQLDSTLSSNLDFGQQTFDNFAKTNPGFDVGFDSGFGQEFGVEVGEVYLDYGEVHVGHEEIYVEFTEVYGEFGEVYGEVLEYGVVHKEVHIEFDYGFGPDFEKFVFFNPEINKLDDFYINELLKAGVPDIVGTDTGSFELANNILDITSGEVRTSLAGIDMSGVTTIKFTGSGSQALTLDSSASGTASLTTVTGSASGSTANDSIFFGPEGGARDFTGVAFSNISFVEYLEEDQRETLKVNASTDFGGASVLKMQQGTGSTKDIFDYTSNLNSGKAAASVSSSSDLTLTEFTSQTSGRTQLSENTTGLVEFNFDEANLAVELQIFGDGAKGGTESAILSAVESKLESTTATSNLTGGANAVLNAADGADMLLVFYESATGISGNTSSDAVMIRYQEDGGDADFSGELSLVASFEGVTDFTDTNIV